VEYLLIHNIAMTSYAAERRGIQEWRQKNIYTESQRQPTFEELLKILGEQANGRKASVSEIWMEVLKLKMDGGVKIRNQ
jgi:hypothetical protein